MDWFDKAVEEIEEAYEAEEISDKEYNEQMRDLNEELRDSANEAAEEARDSILNRW